MSKEKKSHKQHSNSTPFNTSQMGSDVDINETSGMDNTTDSLMNDAQGQIENIKNAPQQIQDTFDNVADVANNIKNAPKKIKDTAKKIKNAPKKIKNTAKKVKNAIKNPKKTLKNMASNAKNGVKNGIKNLGNDIKNALNPKNILDKINPIKKIQRKINNIKNKIDTAKKTAKKTAKSIKNAPKNISNAAKTTAKSIKNAIKLTIKSIKLAIKAIKAAVKLGIKLAQAFIQLIQLLIELIVATWPIWVILLVLGLIIGVIHWILDNDSTSDNKSYTSEQTEYNETSTDENGNAKVTSYSGGTKVTEAFYQYFAEKSLWIVYDGVVHNDEKIEHDDNLGDVYTPMQYNSEEFDEKFKDKTTGEVIIADAEDRESMFYLNPNSLFVFDKYLHDEQIRFPEQLVQHVAYDYNPSALKGKEINETNDKSCLTDYDEPDNRFILKQLTDDDRILNIESQKYKLVDISNADVSDEFKLNNPTISEIYVPDGDEKEIGVWDYGLGSILHYEKYLVKHEKRGSIESFEVWDVTKKMNNDGTISYGTTKKISSYKEYKNDPNKDNYEATDLFADLEGDDRLRVYTNKTDPNDPELADEDRYFIDWVVTAAGDIVNDIVYEWVDSGDPFNRTETKQTSSKVQSYKETLVSPGDTKEEKITRTTSSNSTSSSCSTTEGGDYYTAKVLPKPLRTNVDDPLPETDWDKNTKQTHTWTCNNPDITWDCENKPLNSTEVANECDCKLTEGETCSKDHGTKFTEHTHDVSTCAYHYDHSNCESEYKYNYTEERVDVSDEKNYQNLNAYIKGTRWDKEPYYNGEPDMEHLTGKRYYEDYLTHYDTWIPDGVSGFFNYDSLMKRINATNDEDLNKIIARSSTSSNGANSLTDSTDSGTGTASSDRQAFIDKIAPLAIADGLHTGIYPSITIAQAIYEGGAGKSGLAKNHYNHFGMKAHAEGSTITFWDGSTYTYESVAMSNSNGTLCKWANWEHADSSCLGPDAPTLESDSPSDIGMWFSVMDHGRNFWATSCYGANGVLDFISAGVSVEEGQQQAKDQILAIAKAGYCEGDPYSYYNPVIKIIETYNLWQYDEEFLNQGGWDGTKPYDDLGNNSTGSSSGAIKGSINSIWSWLKGVMKTVWDKAAELFGRDTYYNILDETERFQWNKHSIQENDVDYILQSIFAYTDGKVISEYYGKITDEFFSDYYTKLFSNPIGKNWGSSGDSSTNNTNQTVALNKAKRDKYYPDGCTKPLDECVLSSETSDYGIYFKATEGQNVYSVAKGTVYEIGEDDRYGGKYIIIENGSSKTIYGHLKDIKVSENDSVDKGQIIATVKGDKLFFGITTMTNIVIDPSFILCGFADIDYTLPTVGPYAGIMPRILQRQEALDDYGYGSSTIGSSGCGICAFAMVLSALDEIVYSPTEIVETMDSIAKGKGLTYKYYYQPGVGSVGSVIFPELSKAYGLKCHEFTGSLTTIKEQLDKGRIVIISIAGNGQSNYTGGGHFIVIRGHEGDKFYVNDSAKCYDENTLYTLTQIGRIKNARAIWK